jgi:hypothetical protein
MPHLFDRTEAHIMDTGWLEVIAKAAALGQISDIDPDPAAPPNQDTNWPAERRHARL